MFACGKVVAEVFVFVCDFFKVPDDDVEKGCFCRVRVSSFVEDALAEVGELVVCFFESEKFRELVVC